MAPRTKASIEIDVKGLKAVNDLLNKLNSIDSKVNKINKVAGGKGEKDDLAQTQKVRNQVSKIETKSLRIRNQLVGLNEKDRKVSAIKGRLTRAENKAKKGSLDIANRELVIAEKLLAKQKLSTAEIVKQTKASAKMTAIRQGNFAGSGPKVFGPQPKQPRFRLPKPTQGFDVQSALISGAFPLLFGQGPIGAVAGALGGGIGGMFGGMGGFAGGIAATAVVQQIQTFLDSASKLGQALSPLVQDVTAVTTALGLQGSVQEAQLKLIEETQGKTAAFNAAMKIMAATITQDGVDKLKNFGENTRLLGQQFGIALTKLQAFAAGVANFVMRLTGLQDALQEREATRIVAGAAATGDTRAQELVERRRTAESMRGQGGAGTRKKVLLDQLKLEERIFAINQKVSTEVAQLTSKSSTLLADKEKELALNNRVAEIMKTGVNKELAKSLAEVEQIFDEEQKILLEKQKQTKAAFEKAIIETNDKNLQRELQERYNQITNQLHQHNINREKGLDLTKKTGTETDKVTEAFKRLNETIRNDIKEGIKGLIKGTSTLGDLLNNVADRFLDLALNQALFGNAAGEFTKGKGGGIFGAIAGIFRANGGPVRSGKSFIVGEKGPELFTPGRSGAITPNHKLMGGNNTSVVVNVDASGSDVQGDDAGAKELGGLISVAVQSELVRQQRPGGLLSSIR